MQLNNRHRQTSRFFAGLPKDAAPNQPQFELLCLTPFGTVTLRFASRAELKKQVVDAYTCGVGGLPALGFNVDRASAAKRHEAFEARLLGGYCGLLFLGYPFEILSKDGKDSVGGRPPTHVAHFPTPSQLDEFGLDPTVSVMAKQPPMQRQRTLGRLIARRDAMVRGGGEEVAAFGSALLASSPNDDICDIVERLIGPLAALPPTMVLDACAAAALQLLIQSFGANPCAAWWSNATDAEKAARKREMAATRAASRTNDGVQYENAGAQMAAARRMKGIYGEQWHILLEEAYSRGITSQKHLLQREREAITASLRVRLRAGDAYSCTLLTFTHTPLPTLTHVPTCTGKWPPLTDNDRIR